MFHTGRATPGWIAWPTTLPLVGRRNCFFTPKCAFGRKIIDRPNLFKLKRMAYLTNLRHNIDDFFTCGFIPRPIIKDCEDVLHQRWLHTSQSHGVQSWVSRELDSSLEGEKILFAILTTHTRCLQVVYVIAHVCVYRIYAKTRLYVTYPWQGIHMKFARVNAYYTKLVINP